MSSSLLDTFLSFIQYPLVKATAQFLKCVAIAFWLREILTIFSWSVRFSRWLQVFFFSRWLQVLRSGYLFSYRRNFNYFWLESSLVGLHASFIQQLFTSHAFNPWGKNYALKRLSSGSESASRSVSLSSPFVNVLNFVHFILTQFLLFPLVIYLSPRFICS